MPLASGVRLGPYEIRAPLGSGGMGEVYRARDTRLARDVAVKVLLPSVATDPDRLRRFESEARTAGSLNHGNLLAVYDVGSHEGAPYIVSELLEGETLRARLDQGDLGVRRAVDYAVRIAHGLAAAHQKGIVHRDVKPENVFLTRDGQLKILDFGLAKLRADEAAASTAATASRETRSGVVMGTAGYMSPEQVKGLPADARSDVFTLGVVLYEMLSGWPAFRRETTAEAMAAILKEEPPGIASLNPSVPAGLARVAELCLEKQPEDRFQSARDVALALQALSVSDTAPAPARLGGSGWRRWLVPGLATALALLALAWSLAHTRVPPPPSFSQLTFRRGAVWSARFAPDGATVVYSAAWDGGPSRVYSTRVGSSEARHLGLPDGMLLSISTAGEMALKLGSAFGPYGAGTLARASLAGGAPRELARDVLLAEWDPDGRELAVVRSVDGKARVEYPLGTVLHEASGDVVALCFVGKGSIAFLEVTPEGSHGTIVLALVDQTGLRKELARGWVHLSTAIAWSRATREVWLVGARAGSELAIRGVDLSGRERVVAAFPGYLLLYDLDGRGRALVARETNRWSLMGRAPAEARERDLSWHDQSEAADLSRDGKWVLFTERGARGHKKGSIYLRGMDGAPAVRLGEGIPLALSPDAGFVLALHEQRDDALVVLPTGPGERRVLEHPGVGGYWDAAFGPDGRSFAFVGGAAADRQQVFVWSLDGGAPRPVSSYGRYLGLSVSPDGQWVATGGDRLLLHPVAGGVMRIVPGSVRGVVRQWSSDGRRLFVRQGVVSELPLRVVQVDVASGATHPWKEMWPPDRTGVWRMGAIRLTPDGAGYVYTYRSALGSLYVAEGLR